MAHISKEQVSQIRTQLKKEFKGFKFSVKRVAYSKLSVSIMAAPVSFVEEKYRQLNPFYLDQYQNSDILKRINTICNANNYDNSDSMVDYFDCGFYFELNIGSYDKDFQLTK